MLVLRPCVSSQGVAVSMREAAKHLLLEGFQLWKLEEVSHEMLVLMFPRVSSWVSGFPVALLCLWGKMQNLSSSNVFKQVVMWFSRQFVTFQPVWQRVESFKIGGSLARNARFAAPTCLVSSLWFSCGVAVSLGEAAQPLLFEGFQAGCHVVLKDRRGVLWHSNLFYTVSKILLCGWRRKALHTLHSELYTLHFPLHTLHSTLSTLHSTLYTLHSALYTPHSTTLYTPRSTLYIPHSSLYTPHSTRSTPHSTLYTLHSTLHNLHFRLLTPHFTLYTPHSTLCTPHFTLHTPNSTLYTLHFILYTLHSTLYILHSTLYTPHSSLHTLHFTLYTVHSTLHTLHTLHFTHSTLYTLHTPHSTLYTPHSTLYTPHFIEGSLEVKLPTIWTDEKQSRAEAERRERLEERRVEEKESEERRCRCAKR